MSNNEKMVSVPRAELARLQENMDPYRGAVAWGIVCDLLAKPAEQPHGEPVALPERKDSNFVYGVYGYSSGRNACLDEIAKLGPLFSRPVQDCGGE